jgi:hypothetical protein
VAGLVIGKFLIEYDLRRQLLGQRRTGSPFKQAMAGFVWPVHGFPEDVEFG